MTTIVEGTLPQDDATTKQFVENVKRRHGEVSVTEDDKGNKHYVLHVDPATLGVDMQKAAPDVTPKRPTFTELVQELNRRNPV